MKVLKMNGPKSSARTTSTVNQPTVPSPPHASILTDVIRGVPVSPLNCMRRNNGGDNTNVDLDIGCGGGCGDERS